VASNGELSVNAGPLKLQMVQDGETSVLRLSGELDLSNVTAVERVLQSALADGSSRIVIDLTDLSFIDSTGIALLVTTTAAGNGDGRIAVVPSQAAAVNRVLELTGVAEQLRYVDGDSLSR
jgi:anti-sigma B factor antagonist